MRHYVKNGTKVCARCGEGKSVSEFPTKKRGGSIGVYSYCYPCRAEYNREKNLQRTYEYNRTANLKRKFRLSSSDYNKMLESQGGKCAICGKEPKKVLCVDHCHSSGAVRKLLCNHCNTLIGMAKEDINTLHNAIRYLEEFK